jgi:glycosyltransferase involved in cell wall biosynthesis
VSSSLRFTQANGQESVAHGSSTPDDFPGKRGSYCWFELVGDGELRALIEGLINYHNLRCRVRITGWISGEQVRNEILAARTLVLPSFSEGLPIVIMEVMALKRPVISTFVGGNPELVYPGDHGWLVPAGDVQALADAMQACLDTSAGTLARMGQTAQKRVQRHYADTEAANLDTLFRAAIESPNARICKSKFANAPPLPDLAYSRSCEP